LCFDSESFIAQCRKETPKFSGITTSKKPKLYIASVGEKPIYVGVTKQSIRNRLRFGWNANGLLRIVAHPILLYAKINPDWKEPITRKISAFFLLALFSIFFIFSQVHAAHSPQPEQSMSTSPPIEEPKRHCHLTELRLQPN
jgi:hypothetical protein